MLLSRRAALLCTLTLALAACPGGRKDKKKDASSSDDDGSTVVTRVDSRLSVVSLSPSTTGVDRALEALLRGGGFQTGSRVYVGVTPATTEFVSESSLRVQIPGLPAGRYDVEVQNPDGESAVLRQALLVQDAAPACASMTVYFDLDKSNLRSDSVDLLTANLDCLKAQTAPIQIDGHCDERGTTDYNLALGQRRADAVVRWLTANGVPATRIHATSYGEERPAVVGTDESAWSKNRRAELVLGR